MTSCKPVSFSRRTLHRAVSNIRAVFIVTSVSLLSLCKYLFKLVKGTIWYLVLERAVHTSFAINRTKG